MASGLYLSGVRILLVHCLQPGLILYTHIASQLLLQRRDCTHMVTQMTQIVFWHKPHIYWVKNLDLSRCSNCLFLLDHNFSHDQSSLLNAIQDWRKLLAWSLNIVTITVYVFLYWLIYEKLSGITKTIKSAWVKTFSAAVWSDLVVDGVREMDPRLWMQKETDWKLLAPSKMLRGAGSWSSCGTNSSCISSVQRCFDQIQTMGLNV